MTADSKLMILKRDAFDLIGKEPDTKKRFLHWAYNVSPTSQQTTFQQTINGGEWINEYNVTISDSVIEIIFLFFKIRLIYQNNKKHKNIIRREDKFTPKMLGPHLLIVDCWLWIVDSNDKIIILTQTLCSCWQKKKNIVIRV